MENIPNKIENMEVADETDTRPIELSENENISISSTHRGSIVSTPIVLAAVEEEKYNTTYPNLGIALVINQVNFKRMDKREGSDKDRDNISSALERNGFDVRVFNDLTREDLIAMLKMIASEDHWQNSCLVVVVMTHGEKDVLYASDNVYPVSELWEPFVGDACPSLLEKPKLFFIQACRGNNLDDGVKLLKVVTDTVDARSSPEPQPYVIPTMADLLVMYSTYDGHYSWRNPVNGSWFMQSLSYVLERNAHSDKEKDLLQLLTAVSRKVAYQYQSNVPNKLKMDAKKQMPCIVSMLTKEFYFPKNKNTN
uniref:Short caspase n=1 Tax=Anopheles funestus TaxID=62324 RepID=A0A1I8JUX2_ANOFN